MRDNFPSLLLHVMCPCARVASLTAWRIIGVEDDGSGQIYSSMRSVASSRNMAANMFLAHEFDALAALPPGQRQSGVPW